jgi:Fe-S-cluster formation regulator IscX/YfhJ
VAFVIPKEGPRFEEIDNCFDVIKEKSGCRLYRGDWLKWYDDYPIVIAVRKYLRDLDPTEYRFIRIGEDINDVEDHGELYDPFHLGWTRAIIFDEREDEDGD